jgi:HK97 family phage major capsid protein
MSLTDNAGGYLVPFTLDPAVVLSNTGTSNTALRSAFTVKTIATDTWNGVTSAGVTASWDAEATEVSDDSPTLAGPAIKAEKGSAFIPFSIEVGADAADFAAEAAKMLADAKERLEAAAFVTGAGSGSDEPNGLVTAAVAASKTQASATTDTFAVEDLYALKAALPARWRRDAAWLAADPVYDLIRRFGEGTTGSNSAFWADLAADLPPMLLGKPAWESSELDDSVTATEDNYIAVYGDLQQYYVVDRVGTTIELVPHLFGANRRPTGQRGYYLYFRTGGDLVVTDAVRVLNVT